MWSSVWPGVNSTLGKRNKNVLCAVTVAHSKYLKHFHLEKGFLKIMYYFKCYVSLAHIICSTVWFGLLVVVFISLKNFYMQLADTLN